jgi:cephalosporin-C deacetylase-like acetyl esterase
MPDPGMLQTSRYFDPVNFATRTQAAAVLSVGFIDRVCPPSTVYMAYNNLRGEKQMVNRPLMNHASPQDIKDIFTGIFLEHVEQAKMSD